MSLRVVSTLTLLLYGAVAFTHGCCSGERPTLSNISDHASEQHALVEGVVLDGKMGKYVFEDTGISAWKLLAVITDDSLPGNINLVEKHVKMEGVFIGGESPRADTLAELRQGVRIPWFRFKRVISVRESRYARDIRELVGICGDKKMDFSMEEQPVWGAADAINKHYSSPIVLIDPDGADERVITMCLDDVYVYDAIQYLSRASGLDISLQNGQIILRTPQGAVTNGPRRDIPGEQQK